MYYIFTISLWRPRMRATWASTDILEFKSMPNDNKSPTILLEIERVRRLSSHRKLAPFVRNQTTWELLLIISTFPNLQISEAMDKLETRQLSHSSASVSRKSCNIGRAKTIGKVSVLICRCGKGAASLPAGNLSWPTGNQSFQRAGE